MNRKFVVVLLIAFGSFVFAQQAKLNESAPDFKLIDSNGNEHSLSDFAEKIVVLEWINFDCPFVKKHYDSKNIQTLQQNYAEKGVVWLAVCSSNKGKQGHFTVEEINKRTKNHNAKYSAYLIDEDGTVGKMYGAKTTPHMYIIDAAGTLVYAGGIDDKPTANLDDIEGAKNYVSLGLDELLGGGNVSIQSSTPYGCSVKY